MQAFDLKGGDFRLSGNAYFQFGQQWKKENKNKVLEYIRKKKGKNAQKIFDKRVGGDHNSQPRLTGSQKWVANNDSFLSPENEKSEKKTKKFSKSSWQDEMKFYRISILSLLRQQRKVL
mgnify:CR=1 FL=1